MSVPNGIVGIGHVKYDNYANLRANKHFMTNEGLEEL
jgi:hypothetical protein